MRRARTWLAVSAVLVAVATAGIAARGLNLGVEFTGGRLLEYSTSRPVSADAAREAVADAGFPRAVVQSSSGDGQASGNENVTVRTEPITNDQAFAIERALSAAGGEVTKQRDELIGPSLGEELRNKALVALALALAAQLAYLAIRFRWTFALAAVLAMLHDVLIVVGIFAWLGKPIDGIFLAATLTIIGLSVNDTVVVFDRIRELRRANPLEPLPAVVNRAALQTVPRTINTGLGAMFILAALAILAGDSLTDFAVALLLGLLIGTWSSVFTASPLALLFERRWPALAPARASSAGRDARAGGDRAAVGARPAREVDPVDPYAFVDEAARDGGPAGGGWNRNG
jgi:SecD/SecF fusion protein